MFLRAVFATLTTMFLSLVSMVSFAVTAAAFVAATPLFVVFSPVLVPAGITTGLLVTSLAAGGGGITSVTIILGLVMKIYKLATGKEPPAMLKRALARAKAAAKGGAAAPQGGAPPGGASPPAAGGAPTLNLPFKPSSNRN